MEKLMRSQLLNALGFRRAAIAAVAALPFLVGGSLFGQAPAQSPAGSDTAGAATVERIVVTGSLIPTAEEVTASPVDTLNTSDVNIAGPAPDVLTVLQKRNPDFVGGGNLGSTNANIASGATQGGSIISLRGLPTLVLFEGRRIADSAAISSGGFQFTDVSIFPTSLISRIEVLKDGASALYGSEAVGGVVNIFMKDDFTGVEVGARYGFTVESGVAERKAYAIAGVGNDTTHVVGGFQYYEIDPLFARERDYSKPALNLTTTFAGVGRDNLGGGTTFYFMKPNVNSPFDVGAVPGGIAPPPPDSDGANPGQYAQLPQAYDIVPSVLPLIDLSKLPTSTLGINNTDAYGSFNHQIFGKQLEIFGNFMYANNHNFSQLNAQPLSNGTGVIILGSQRVDPATGDLIPEDRGAPAPFNPFQLSIDTNTLGGNYRLFANNRYQNHPREFTNDSNFYRFLIGLRSQIAKDWTVETAAYYSTTTSISLMRTS
jgi:iron complex outermembrane receptor protein